MASLTILAKSPIVVQERGGKRIRRNHKAYAVCSALHSVGVSVQFCSFETDKELDGDDLKNVHSRCLVVPGTLPRMKATLLTLALFPGSEDGQGSARLLASTPAWSPREIQSLFIEGKAALVRLLRWIHQDDERIQPSDDTVEAAWAAFRIKWHADKPRFSDDTNQEGRKKLSFEPETKEQLKVLLEAYASAPILKRLLGDDGRRLLSDEEGVLRQKNGGFVFDGPDRISDVWGRVQSRINLE